MRRDVNLSATREFIPTSHSLLKRLKDKGDDESWREFYHTYWRLIYKAATKAGLGHAEAQDIVQETILSVTKSMANFEYRRDGSFKKWLLRLTAWRIADEVRKRIPTADPPQIQTDTSTISSIECIPDNSIPLWLSAWDKDLEKALLQTAIKAVKEKVEPENYQMFDLCVFHHWKISRVARAFYVNPARVYLAKHRIARRLKKELSRLRAMYLDPG